MSPSDCNSDTSENPSHVNAAASSSTSPPEILGVLYEQLVSAVVEAVLQQLPVSKPWLTVREAAEQTQLSEKSILRALASGSLVGTKRKRHWRVRAADLEEWMTRTDDTDLLRDAGAPAPTTMRALARTREARP